MSESKIGNYFKQKMSNFTQSIGNIMVIFVVFKLMRIGLSFASLLISKNITSQIYMDKVLVQDENPPHLKNFIYLYSMIEFTMSVVTVLLLYTLNATFDLKLISAEVNIFTEYLIPDMIVSSGINMILGLIIADVMFNKKYFLYKDDGLRGIRALNEIMLKTSVVINLIPFNFIFKGIIKLIKDS